MSFSQGNPAVSHVISTANCLVFGNTSSGNALSVQQLGAGNVATFQTTTGATALFINPAGRVGVGTAAPLAPLHTLFSTSGIPDTTGSGTSNVATRFQVGSVALDMGNIVNGNMWLQNHLITNWGANYPMLLNPNGGPVGVGTTSTASTVHIYSSNAGNPTGGAGTGSDANAAVRVQMQTVGIDIGTTGAGATWFQNRQPATSLSTVLPISLNPIGGNVGIGLTNPSHQLTVTSNIYNQSSGGGFYGMNCGNLNGLIQGIYNGGPTNPDGQANSDMFIGVNYDQYTGQRFAGTNHGVAQIQLVGANPGAGAIRFRCAAGGTGALSSVPVIATVTTTGVGIGITNPGEVLGMSSTGNCRIRLQSYSGTYPSSYWNFGPENFRNVILYNDANTGVYITYGSTAWSANSDSRLKNIIAPISNALAKVDRLNPVLYSWKKDDTNAAHPGLIAQDVLEVQPEAVSTTPEGMYGVQYTELIPLAFAAIKELSAENTALKTQLTAMDARLAALEKAMLSTGTAGS